MNYLIDGELLTPQPLAHEWEPDIQGHDGGGAPFRALLRSAILRVDLLIAEFDWLRYRDDLPHSLTLPEPGTLAEWKTYTGCYIDDVTTGPIVQGRGFDGLTMRIIRIDVSP